MAPTNKNELKAALADKEQQLKWMGERLFGHLGEKEWLAALDEIIKVREAQKQLEARLAALEQRATPPNTAG